MVHELLGIRNGRVDMSQVPDIRPELSVSYRTKRRG
jgi:vacuolar protein sorting-associated protein 45